MKIELQENEKIIRKGAANHFKGIESVGGRLFLTNHRLYFSSHAMNVQTHHLSVPCIDILSVGKRNTLGIIPNGMFIELKNGQKEKFVLWGRGKWIREIEQQISM